MNLISVSRFSRLLVYTCVRTLKSCMQVVKARTFWKLVEINANIVKYHFVLKSCSFKLWRLEKNWILYNYVEFQVQRISTLTSKHYHPNLIIWKSWSRTSLITALFLHIQYRSSIRKETWIPACCLNELIVVWNKQGISSGPMCGPDAVFLSHANSSSVGSKE